MMFDVFTKDIRYAVRGLFKRPGFTAIVVITLALGIGTSTAIFSVVNAVLLRPLPYPNSDQLVMIWGEQIRGVHKWSASPQEFLDYRDRNHSFSGVATYTYMGRDLTGGAGDPERVETAKVTAQFFSVLGTQPLRGRSFLSEEDQVGRDRVAIISYGLWQRRFAGDDNVAGQNLMLDGVSHTVVGVMPADFQFPEQEIQIWTPMALGAKYVEENRGSHYLPVIARLKPGIDLHQAQADVASIAAQLQKEYPSEYEQFNGWSVNLVTARDEIVGDSRLVWLILLGIVSFVWLIACLNVANLLLARAASRHHEITVRAALGAGRLQLIRHSLAETLLLSMAGGALGLIMGSLGAALIKLLNPANLPRIDEIQVDHRVLIFTFTISLVTGLVFGVIPAMQASKLNLLTTLNESVSKVGEGKKRNRLHAFLITGEVGIAMILLVGAGLLIKSFYRLQQIDLGFNPANVATMRLSLPATRYAEPHQMHGFFNELVSRTEHLPGVESVALVNTLPLKGSMEIDMYVEGQPENSARASLFMSTPKYLNALGIELQKGRFFEDQDRDNTTYVAVVNEAFARVFLHGEEALGKRVKIGGPSAPFPWYSIVGVIKDVRHYGADVAAKPELFIPHTQPVLGNLMLQSLSLAVRTEGNPEGSIAGVRAIVRELDPELPVYDVWTMQQLVDKSVATRRFNMFLVGIFSALALALAAIGIYGVMSYTVTARTREIGIRMALGARAVSVLSLVIRDGMRLALAGLAIGIGGAFALTRLMRTLLFDVTPTDPSTFAGVAILLFVVALLACFLPARRASEFNPIDALRHE